LAEENVSLKNPEPLASEKRVPLATLGASDVPGVFKAHARAGHAAASTTGSPANAVYSAAEGSLTLPGNPVAASTGAPAGPPAAPAYPDAAQVPAGAAHADAPASASPANAASPTAKASPDLRVKPVAASIGAPAGPPAASASPEADSTAPGGSLRSDARFAAPANFAVAQANPPAASPGATAGSVAAFNIPEAPVGAVVAATTPSPAASSDGAGRGGSHPADAWNHRSSAPMLLPTLPPPLLATPLTRWTRMTKMC